MFADLDGSISPDFGGVLGLAISEWLGTGGTARITSMYVQPQCLHDCGAAIECSRGSRGVSVLLDSTWFSHITTMVCWGFG